MELQQAAVVGERELFKVAAAAQVREPEVDSRGRWIVAAMNLDGHSDLYRVELDGKSTRLTNDTEGNYAPATIGDSIVYVSSRDGDSEIRSAVSNETGLDRAPAVMGWPNCAAMLTMEWINMMEELR